jgi:hypothetical protein
MMRRSDRHIGSTLQPFTRQIRVSKPPAQKTTSMQGEGGRRQMSMLGISMEKWIVLMIIIFLCCLGRKFTGPDEQNIQTIMGVIEAEPGLRHWGFTRDAEIHPVYNFLTANINLLQRTRGQRADRSCTLFHAFSLFC